MVFSKQRAVLNKENMHTLMQMFPKACLGTIPMHPKIWHTLFTELFKRNPAKNRVFLWSWLHATICKHLDGVIHAVSHSSFFSHLAHMNRISNGVKLLN